jgi:hypothetical protein
MAVEVGLADGTKLQLANPNASEDAVVESLNESAANVMTLNTTAGRYRVLIRQVVYVRTVEEEEALHRGSARQ